MAVVPEGFEVGEKLRLTKLINQKECEGVLVWRGNRGDSGWELGMHLQRLSQISGSWISKLVS